MTRAMSNSKEKGKGPLRPARRRQSQHGTTAAAGAWGKDQWVYHPQSPTLDNLINQPMMPMRRAALCSALVAHSRLEGTVGARSGATRDGKGGASVGVSLVLSPE